MNLQQCHTPDSNEIFEDLCDKIEMLVYMPGQRISENELCTLYGATRHMVRGALMRLKQKRLIEVYPQRGTFVSLIDMGYISDILFMRESMEQEALRRIVDSGQVEELCHKMHYYIEEQKRCRRAHSEDSYTKEFYELDNAFHACFYQAVGREQAVSFISEHYIHFRRWRNFEIRYSERMKRLIQEHEELVEAIEERDAEKARCCLHKHLDTVSSFGESATEDQKKYIIFS